MARQLANGLPGTDSQATKDSIAVDDLHLREKLQTSRTCFELWRSNGFLSLSGSDSFSMRITHTMENNRTQVAMNEDTAIR